MDTISRAGTLATQVENTIRDRIIFGEIKLGSRISEQQLADSLGVSKSPVRNALLHLQQEDLVEILPQKGTFVFKPDEKQLRDVCLLRTVLEPVALVSAHQKSHGPFLAALKAIYHEMEASMAAGRHEQYILDDLRFHDQFFDFSQNPYLKKSYRMIRSLLAVLRVQLKMDDQHLHKSYVGHKELIEALENHDMPRALAVLDEHIAFNEKSYWNDIAGIVEHMYAEPVQMEA